jgi:hypothetical protein
MLMPLAKAMAASFDKEVYNKLEFQKWLDILSKTCVKGLSPSTDAFSGK